MRVASSSPLAILACILSLSVLACGPGSNSRETCGNGSVEGTEACDDGNRRDGDGCSASCQVELPPAPDCAGAVGGAAHVDQCGQCVGGTTGRLACVRDCAGVYGGQASTDQCGRCAGGTTGQVACAQDCAGVYGGQASLDRCGRCAGGTTGQVACVQDCAGVYGGQASTDQCGRCAGGTTGQVACAQDCAGVYGGQASTDQCGRCAGGTTGLVACAQDCAGVYGGQASTDQCGRCAGGTTGQAACAQDCAGVWGGQASTDRCGQCVGGTTGQVACAQDCAGTWGGAAQADTCGRCAGGTTGRTPCSAGACRLGPGETIQGLVDNPACAVVELPNGTHYGAIKVDLARMGGKRAVEVRGTSRAGTAISAGGLPTFRVEAGATLRLAALTIRGGTSGDCVAVSNLGVASLDGVTVADNTTSNRGAICNEGRMEIRASAVTGNATGSTYFTSALGGAIYNSGDLYLGATTVSGNRARSFGQSYGGGICNDGGTLVVEDGDISGNLAESLVNSGGALDGGGLFSYFGTVDLRRTSVHHNRVEHVGTAARGGGISAWGGTVQLSPDCDVSFNEVTAGDDVRGAGLYVEQRGQLLMDGVTVEGNVGRAGTSLGGAAVSAWRASLSLAGNRLVNNRLETTGSYPATAGGGVLSVAEGTLTMTSGLIAGNTLAVGYANGGLVQVADVTYPSEADEALLLDGVEVTGNAIHATDGVDGGLVWAVGRLRLKDCDVHANTVEVLDAVGSTGGLVAYVDIRNFNPDVAPPTAEFVVEGTRVAANTVTFSGINMTGGLFHLSLDREDPVVVTFRNATVVGNSFTGPRAWLQGGIAYLEEARHVLMADSAFSDNVVVTGRDGVTAQPGTIHGGVFYHSFTGGFGSVSDDGSFELVRTDVSRNRIGTVLATNRVWGGVVLLYVPWHLPGHLLTFAATNSTFSLNQAQARTPAEAGLVGLFSRSGSNVLVDLASVTVASNETNGTLSAVDDLGWLPPGETYGTTTLRLRNTIFTGNATAPGGACPLQGPNAQVVSAGYNLLGDLIGCAGVTLAVSDLVGVEPLLGPYGDHGGPVPSLPLMPPSPAVDGGDPAGCSDAGGALLTVDQRGLPRPAGARCDIGAFELQGP